MSEVVTFTDYTPPPRMDNNPWTQVLIYEAADQDGPWTLIDTLAIAAMPGGVDVDPQQPATRSFTTTQAQISQGWYQINFKDAAGHLALFDPIHNVEDMPQEWLPTITDVALLTITRTKDMYGNELGTFTSATRPTNVQASEIIVDAGDKVTDVIGSNIPEVLWRDAAAVIAERAAMDIELAYFPEQVNTDRSPYKILAQQFEKDLELLARQVQIVNDGGDPSVAVDTSPSLKAVGAFPDQDKYPPYGLTTRW